MTKLELLDSIKTNIKGDQRTKINFDELAAYVLTLMQYGIRLYHRDINGDLCEVIGICAQGIIYKLGSCLFQQTKYPASLDINADWLMASIGNDSVHLFDKTVKIVRPPKRGCAFGKEMVSIVDMRIEGISDNVDLEF